MTINKNNKNIIGLYKGNIPINVIYKGNNIIYNRHIQQDWQGSATGTNIWGTNNSISGYTGTQSSAFNFTNPQQKGKWKFTFDWSGQSYVTQYNYNLIVTYEDNTTETLHSGTFSGYIQGGSGTQTDTYNFQKKWKSIRVEHSRSIITTIYCYSYFGNVRMEWNGSDQ